MAIYYFLYVGHAVEAELYGVPVENFPQFVTRWERSFNEADERTSDDGFDAFVTWWIKPYNISLFRLCFCDGGCCGGGLNSSLKA